MVGRAAAVVEVDEEVAEEDGPPLLRIITTSFKMESNHSRARANTATRM